MTGERRRRLHITLLILAILTVASGVAHFMYVSAFNETLHVADGLKDTEDTYMDLHFRGDATSAWVKQDLDIYGNTYDGALYNKSTYSISSWMLRINIIGDCYINQFWNGTVEIHQYVGTEDECVQTLDLGNYDESKIQLYYEKDGTDLLIPLQKGDYIVYFPNEEFKEMPIQPEDEVVVGGVFYYKDDLDLSDYSLEYYYHINFDEGVGFFLTCLLLVLFGLVLFFYFISYQIYKRAEMEMEMQKSGISCMTELYALIYIINIEEDTLTPVGVEEQWDEARPKDIGANDQLQNMFHYDATEEYLDTMLEFADLTTIQERMKEKNSLVIEYVSKYYGWCRIHYIAMDRKAEEPLQKVLFTVEQIGEEKERREEMLAKVERAESESKAKSTFLANMSHEIRTPINTVLGLDTMILRESSEDNIKSYARDIKNAGNMLLSLINSILDFSKLEAGKMELIPAEYSVKKMIYDVLSITRSKVESKGLDFIVDVSPSMPDKLYGDDVRLKQIIINLLTNASKYTDSGEVRLGFYGKALNQDTLHILVSVKDSGSGIKPDDLKKLSQRFARFDEEKNRNVEGTGIGMNLVNSLLALMGTELKVASIYGKGSDFYFEIEQKIVDSEPIGTVDWEHALFSEDEEYEVGFTAEEARILVVDDNGMNLNVFSNLLKETKIQIDKAFSGAEALDYTKENKYDLIFMDHMMPEMDGVEAMHRIKEQKDGLNRETTVIVLTANAVTGAKEEYLKEGFHDFLSKPIEVGLLEEKILNNIPKEKMKEVRREASKEKKSTKGTGLPEIEGIDSAYALEHVGSAEGVVQIIRQFVDVAEMEKKELESYYEKLKENPSDEDALNSYRIKVHAMKTSASLCGSLMVYGAAAQLEFAAIAKNVDAVLDITPYFLNFWMELYDKLNRYVEQSRPKDEVKDKISTEKFQSLIHQLQTAMAAFDIGTCDEIMEELKSFDVGSEMEPKIKQLSQVVAALDSDACEELCKEIMS